jgi:hypothetical protein
MLYLQKIIFFNFLLCYLSGFFCNFLRTTYRSTNAVGGLALTSDQQRAGASSQDNIGGALTKGIETLSPYLVAYSGVILH